MSCLIPMVLSIDSYLRRRASSWCASTISISLSGPLLAANFREKKLSLLTQGICRRVGRVLANGRASIRRSAQDGVAAVLGGPGSSRPHASRHGDCFDVAGKLQRANEVACSTLSHRRRKRDRSSRQGRATERRERARGADARHAPVAPETNRVPRVCDCKVRRDPLPPHPSPHYDFVSAPSALMLSCTSTRSV